MPEVLIVPSEILADGRLPLFILPICGHLGLEESRTANLRIFHPFQTIYDPR
jgi:hypothetical protein